MPPKKKRRIQPQPQKPGKARQYIAEAFSVLPECAAQLRNGHVLFAYLENQRSPIETVHALAGSFNILSSQVQNLVTRSLKKYDNVSREADFQKLKDICEETFVVTEQCSATKEPPATPPAKQEVTSASVKSECAPKSSSSTPVLRHTTSMTPRKQKLVRRLQFAYKSKSEMKKSHAKSLKVARERLNKLGTVKHLNQVIKRKQQTINRLRNDLKNNLIAKQLRETKSELYRVKKNHQRLKSKKRTRPDIDSNKISDLQRQLKDKDQSIKVLENENAIMEEQLHDSECSKIEKVGKSFPIEIRLLTYDFLVNNVPTRNIPALLEKATKRLGVDMNSIPHRTTVECMARELGVISDLMASETLLENVNLTLCFDATTQNGVQVNEVHVTSMEECIVLGLDQLPGGTAEDYERHILETVDRIADVHSVFYGKDFVDTRKSIINNIANTLTDRAAVNNATIQRLEDTWAKPLQQLNCHLHPLDTIASSARSVLKAYQPGDIKGKVYGQDCVASNIVVGMNKLRYKDGKGDPKGFISFLDEVGLPRGILPRYRGNRLHILFHTCGQLLHHHKNFEMFLETRAAACGGLSSALAHDMKLPVAKVQMQVLGLMGKHLTGPWMSRFYTADIKTSHMDAIDQVREVVTTMKTSMDQPKELL